ncbi:MAG: hypothetical protein E7183_08260 [Erysipelotrichaceae bacterium]|nr:hypothetical protein [Erysipelotrichaceae bacterium]
MKKSFVKTCLLLCFIFIISFCVSCEKKCKNHEFINGVCSKCEEVDPNYKPHTHEYVKGVCICGEKDPNYNPHVHEYVDGKCSCGLLDPSHTHIYIEGICECGEKDSDYKPEPVIYTINFNLNGGSISNALKEYDGSVDVTLPTPTKEGYEFGGWYDNPEFNGSSITEILAGSKGDKVFYAKWIVKQHVHEYINGICECGDISRPIGFDGQSMEYVIKVYLLSENDPFNSKYLGESQALKQAHQKDVEALYNIKIKYSEWGKDDTGKEYTLNNVKADYLDKSLEKQNVYVAEISTDWISMLVENNVLTELYDLEYETGYFDLYNYDPYDNLVVYEAASVNNKVYGFQTKMGRPDYFLYYNASKVASLGIEDPAEMWFKGEWTWSNFDKWVEDAQSKLGDDEYAIDCDYADFLIGACAAQGSLLVSNSRKTIIFGKSSVTNVADKMKTYYKEGYWNTKHGVQEVSTNFKEGKTLLHNGSIWYLNESIRFTPEGEENGINFTMGVVPYPIDQNTEVTPYTAPYTYEDTEGNLVEVTEPLKTRSNEPLTNNDGDAIYGIDLSESNYLIPYTGSEMSCYSIFNYEGEGQNGINSIVAFDILYYLLLRSACDPNSEGYTSDNIYRLYLNKKLDNSIDVEVIMSVQDSSLLYYDPIKTLSIKAGNGYHTTNNGLWLVLSNMMISEETPAELLKELVPIYQEILDS